LILFSSCKEESPSIIDDINLFNGCVSPGTLTSLEIVTLNVEDFPKAGDNSVTVLAELIKAMNPDVVALQEVRSETDFNDIDKQLVDYTGYLNPTTSQALDLAYFVKDSEISVDSSQLLFEKDTDPFPRAPFEIRIMHKLSKKELYLINIHLKAYGGEKNLSRRRLASQKLKSYLDSSRPNDRVIILGDYNDEISSTSMTENPFINFIHDPDNYIFTDMNIAKGNSGWWSYPSWPSHIDHILVTNELFPSIDTCFVVRAGDCYEGYEKVISDHRPVEVKITL
jgi:endonuclease/exonuclease/phosphatase family metal-dependent hydrolase